MILVSMPIQKLNQEDLARRLSRCRSFAGSIARCLCEEIDTMRRVIGFEPNSEGEDELEADPGNRLKRPRTGAVPEYVARGSECSCSPIIFSLYQREVS